jgi:hypothetical protein
MWVESPFCTALCEGYIKVFGRFLSNSKAELALSGKSHGSEWPMIYMYENLGE